LISTFQYVRNFLRGEFIVSVIVPFKALRPQKQFVRDVASLPYDVVSSEEAKHIAGDKPLNFLHVEKSEIDLPSDIPAHDQRIYETAKENVNKLLRKGVLFQDTKPCFYIYSQEMNGRRQYGIVGGISVAEYEVGKIKKHELTRSDKEIDRIRHVDTISAHTGPVLITYRMVPSIDRMVEETIQERPEYDFTTDDGISHRVWVVGNEEKISAIIAKFAELDSLYIADGHHRAAAAAAVAKMRRGNNPTNPDAEYENIMAVLFPHTQLKIMDYNRVVKDLNGLRKADFLDKCRGKFFLSDNFYEKSPRYVHEFGMYLAGRWYKLISRDGAYDENDPVGRLDVFILQEHLLNPILGIRDPRSDKRIEFVGGIRGMQELERLVDSGKFSVAFSLYPPTIEQLMEVADASRIMPPKSTWFEPKLRSGIFTHLLG
jgi:uncharacterized protein (DUF1015 family)